MIGSMDRPNTELARAVDDAFAMLDVRAAAEFLAHQGASFPLICRVLGEPSRRRAANATTAIRQEFLIDIRFAVAHNLVLKEI